MTAMPNVTLSIDEKLLALGRDYARRRGTSLNAMIRELLSQHVAADGAREADELFSRMDAARGDSRGRNWSREDIHQR
ncbi:MAG: hypothetical protein R6V85_00450 [Polyangia bacterium]